MHSYLLKVKNSRDPQTALDDSFFGGKPNLPQNETIPDCKLCGAKQSFMLQVAMPATSPWNGLTLAIFACTGCAKRNHFIPEMLSGPLHDADIPEGFLDAYQLNFRFLVFETASAIIREDYEERVKFKRLELESIDDPDLMENKLGGKPAWLLGDETPKSYANKTPLFFILQLLPDFQFETVPGAPRQVELALDGSTEASPFDYYQLFIGNAIYLFGATDRTNPKVYALTQI